MNNGSPYRVPRDPGRWRAFALAALVHAALFAFLWFGVNWQNETPVAVEAEVWSPQVREAAPKPKAPPPPEPEVQAPHLAPQPKPQLPREIQPPVDAPQPKAPDIALERETKRRLLEREQAARNAEERRRTQQEAREEERRRAQAALRADEADARKRELAQQEVDKKRRQQAAQQANAQEKRQRDDQQKKLALEKQQKQQKAEQQDIARSKAAHDDQVRRLAASIDSPTGSGGNGDTAKSQGPRADASYTQKVGAKIKSNTIFNGADELGSNPAVEISVELLPDGSIRRQRKLKSSGVPGFDEAVARAIDKSQPFPPDKSGTVPSSFVVSHKPKDQ